MKLNEIQQGSTFKGVTLIAEGHTHNFIIRFNLSGKILSGSTSSNEGHSHQIKKMGRTEEADGHSHGLPIVMGGRGFIGRGIGRTPPGGPGSMTGGGTGGGGMTGTGAMTGTPGTGTPSGGGGGNGGG